MGLIADPQEITPGFWLLVSLLLIAPLALMLLVPRRWLWRAGLGWLLLPIIAMAAGFVLLLAVGAGDPSATPGNALLAVGYIGIFTIIPWALVASVGLGLGLLARRIFRRGDPQIAEAEPRTEPVESPGPMAETNVDAAKAPSHMPPYTGMTTEQLHDHIRAKARELGLGDRLLPLIGYPDNGAPFAYVDHRGLQLGYFERGQMFDSRMTRDLDEMLYWVFDHVTFDMACETAREGMTYASQMGPRVLEAQDALLARLHPQWHARWLTDPYCQASYYRREAQP